MQSGAFQAERDGYGRSHTHFAVILGKLMSGRRQCIAAARIPKFVRAQLDEFRDIGAIDFEHDIYRISEAALTSATSDDGHRRSARSQSRISLPNNPNESLPSIRISLTPIPESTPLRSHSGSP